MPSLAEDLELAIQHVREGTERVLHQADLIERLKAQGRDTAEAEDLLAEFERTLGLMQDHHRRLQAKYDAL